MLSDISPLLNRDKVPGFHFYVCSIHCGSAPAGTLQTAGIYSFSHLTFQEYFTAKYIVDNATQGTTKNLINTHLLDNRWREVFLLTASMLEEADAFLLAMKVKIDTMLQNQKLYQFLQEVYNTIREESSYPTYVNRTFAIFFVLNGTFDPTSDFELASNPNLNQAGDFVRVLAHSLDPDLTYNLSPDFGHNLFHTRIYTSDFDHALAQVLTPNLFHDHTSALIDYLQANQLLVDCLSTECYVTKDTRQKIMDTLLALPEEKG